MKSRPHNIQFQYPRSSVSVKSNGGGGSGTSKIKKFRFILFLSIVFCLVFIYLNSPSTNSNLWCNSSSSSSSQTSGFSNFVSPLKFHVDENDTKADNDGVLQYLQVYNEMGKIGADWPEFETLLSREGGSLVKKFEIFSTNRENYLKIQEKLKLKNSTNSTKKDVGDLTGKPQINLAVVACGSRKEEAMVMLKSAVLFSQDVHLHLILFSDKKTILDLASLVLELKWTVQARGWDFSHELHLDWFPHDHGTQWKSMWAECSTLRLFFPTLLPHIDSLIYLDSDVLIVSNLTELWNEFKVNMREYKLAAMAPNNEKTAAGWYNTMSKVPYFGERGVNAGVMLMNLTQMRDFDLQERSMSIHTVFKEKIYLADQDILNILFHGYPEKLHVLNCSYNFNWVHCGHGELYPCYNQTGHSHCFCRAVLEFGVQIVHGNGKTFYDPFFPFLNDIFKEFKAFDLLLDSETQLLSKLKENFRKFDKPCNPLTAELMYDNGLKYLKSLS